MKPASKKIPATQSSLAAKLGVARQLISYHCKKKDTPPLNDVEGWQVYLAGEGREAGLPPKLRHQIGEQRLIYLTKQTEKLDLENSVKRSETISFTDAQNFICNLVENFFFGELDRLSNELPLTLKGCREVEIKQEMDKKIEAIKDNLRQKLATMLATDK